MWMTCRFEGKKALINLNATSLITLTVSQTVGLERELATIKHTIEARAPWDNQIKTVMLASFETEDFKKLDAAGKREAKSKLRSESNAAWASIIAAVKMDNSEVIDLIGESDDDVSD